MLLTKYSEMAQKPPLVPFHCITYSLFCNETNKISQRLLSKMAQLVTKMRKRQKPNSYFQDRF